MTSPKPFNSEADTFSKYQSSEKIKHNGSVDDSANTNMGDEA
jgi:hypothetical protein